MEKGRIIGDYIRTTAYDGRGIDNQYQENRNVCKKHNVRLVEGGAINIFGKRVWYCPLCNEDYIEV
jgi:hypothetical protein